MAQFWGKGRILHVSYLLNQFGDPNFFLFFYYVLIIKFTPGKFQKIFISTTITDKLPNQDRFLPLPSEPNIKSLKSKLNETCKLFGKPEVAISKSIYVKFPCKFSPKVSKC